MKKNLIIIILLIIVLGLSGYITYDKLINTNEDNNQNETAESKEDFLSKFIGKYQYKSNISKDVTKEEIEKCNTSKAIFDIAELEINDNSTYTFKYGSNCGSGYINKGNYAINNNKIYLFNDECKITKTETGEYVYPNCEPLIVLNYTETNEKFNITYRHFSGNNLKLEKIS